MMMTASSCPPLQVSCPPLSRVSCPPLVVSTPDTLVSVYQTAHTNQSGQIYYSRLLHCFGRTRVQLVSLQLLPQLQPQWLPTLHDTNAPARTLLFSRQQLHKRRYHEQRRDFLQFPSLHSCTSVATTSSGGNWRKSSGTIRKPPTRGECTRGRPGPIIIGKRWDRGGPSSNKYATRMRRMRNAAPR